MNNLIALQKPSVRKLVAALSEEGGATLHPSGDRFAGTAYMVADPEFTTVVKNAKDMKNFLGRRDVKNAMDGGKLIGKWTDPETGLTEINLSDAVLEEKAAQKLAAQRGEQAVGHIKEGAYQGDVANPHAPVGAVKRMVQGMQTSPLMKRITEIPSTRGRQLADAYEALPKNDPAAKASYDALNAEVEKQFQTIKDAGYKIEFTDADPYKNSAEMMKDVRENKTLKVFKTPRPPERISAAAVRNQKTGEIFDGLNHADAFEKTGPNWEDRMWDYDQGFRTNTGRFVSRPEAVDIHLGRPAGTAGPDSRLRAEEVKGIGAAPPADFHPYMTPEQNDRFRAVHDFLAHAGGGNTFSAPGEENAFRVHASTLSKDALPALASETRGQNSWVNFGPNSHLPVKERPFAEQKAAMFPENLLGEYEAMGPAGAPNVRVNSEWKPTSRQVFDRSPEQGVPAGEYREPAPLPFETEPRPRAGATELAEQLATDPRVERRIASDVEKGLPLGGRPWYGLLGLRRYLESLPGAVSFDQFNLAGAAGSARTSTHNELTNMSLLLYAMKRGVPYEEARQEFLRRFPGTMRPTFMGMHGDIFDRGLERGAAVPVNPVTGDLKIPNYFHNRMMKALGIPLDTHEMRMLGQSVGRTSDEIKAGLPDAESYNLAAQPYHRIARRFGLHPDQVQAARWLGGGLETGLKSQPRGDFLQTLEDGLLFTARQRGLDESPKGLRRLMDAIARGEDFFLPTPREGGFPVY